MKNISGHFLREFNRRKQMLYSRARSLIILPSKVTVLCSVTHVANQKPPDPQVSEVKSFQSIWKTLMRPKPLNKLYCSAAKYKLPQALHRKIRTQVSENPQHFIQQILTGGSYFVSLSHPECCSVKMLQPNTEAVGRDEEIHQRKSGEKTSHSHECSSGEKGGREGNDKWRGKRNRNQLSGSSDEGRPPKRKSPNYFVGVRITDPQIHSTAKRIQEKILEASDIDIRSTRIDPVKFHVTLMVMHLENDEAVRRAEETLENLGPIIADKLGGREVVLEFKGLSVFGGGRVVFTPPQPTPGLDDLISIAGEIVTQMKENGIYSTDSDKKVLHPHLTLFKFKDDKHLFRQGVRKIKESLYAPFREEHFGYQKLASIQLCEMGEKTEGGYYVVKKEVAWQQHGTWV